MEALFVIIAIIVAIVKYVAKHPAAEKAADAPRTSEETSLSRTIREQKCEQMARVEQWRAAKTQQDDAQQLHSIKMDTCESKLESLRVLYDAGILDREEYAQRVERVKRKHHEA